MSGSEQVIVEDALPQPLFEQCKQALLQMAADEVSKGTSPLEGSDRGGGFPPTVTAACFSQANDLLVASESREGSFALISVSLDEARDMHEQYEPRDCMRFVHEGATTREWA